MMILHRISWELIFIVMNFYSLIRNLQIKEWVTNRSSMGQKDEREIIEIKTVQLLIYEKYFNVLRLSIFFVYTGKQMIQTQQLSTSKLNN